MRALIGHSGFVGTNLKRAAAFDALYNSADIADIRGRAFDLVVCAAAPATMWAANADPARDLAGIDALVGHLAGAAIDRLVLVSTIAVLDDAAAGYDETGARYETAKAYGRNRRHLELALSAQVQRCHILRLPALFGHAIKKNFVFDLINPVPSFLKPDRLSDLLGAMPAESAAAARAFFVPDTALGMMRFERDAARAAGHDRILAQGFAAAGFTAPGFTNSESRFQYYALDRLWDDIKRCLAAEIPVLHVASAPLRAADIHLALTGTAFDNPGPPLYAEDMHSRYCAQWGGPAPYLYSAADTLADLTRFYREAVGA
ncbi:sugar nucleotide-binding protein [Aquabacter spiritensis]|uniref:RmlD substrate binding domain-containing protein n=1 Tax=Aquabacter spiritensis TaxID=933073 RepID=A0A4R3M4R7_9HYPH|nr:sugar nucleotide-binding protein [Aquabacter spiritensis]TCT06185.1 RmlD substrate binding domain-containing protein [Aquabacter spiritensis]